MTHNMEDLTIRLEVVAALVWVLISAEVALIGWTCGWHSPQVRLAARLLIPVTSAVVGLAVVWVLIRVEWL